MRSLNLVVVGALCAGLALTGCSDDATTGTSGPSLMTTVVPGTVVAGEEAQVSCAVAGFPVPAEELTVIVVAEPADGITIKTDRVETESAGTYTLRCSVPEYEVVDNAGLRWSPRGRRRAWSRRSTRIRSPSTRRPRCGASCRTIWATRPGVHHVHGRQAPTDGRWSAPRSQETTRSAARRDQGSRRSPSSPGRRPIRLLKLTFSDTPSTILR